MTVSKASSPNSAASIDKTHSKDHSYRDLASSVVCTALNITKELGELLKDVPYVCAVAGVILQIIKIRDVSGPANFINTQLTDP